MEDSAPITGSPTIDRAIHCVTGNATNPDLLGPRPATTTSRAMLDFEAAETPSSDAQLQLLIRERSSLQNTVSKLEATVQRAMDDIEAKDQEISALKNDKSQHQQISKLQQQQRHRRDRMGHSARRNRSSVRVYFF